jgi:integrase/recombinase XerD
MVHTLMKRKVESINKSRQQQLKQQQHVTGGLTSLQRRIEAITADLQPNLATRLQEQSKENTMTICNYILAMKTEINPSRQYRQTTIQILCYISKFHNQKPFAEITRDDIVLYLDSLRKTEVIDPHHHFIGTYNLRRVVLLRFFKWLHASNAPQNQRRTPVVMENIPKLRRKEITTIKPSDLWTEEDDALFMKYCSNKRDRVYHMISRDSSCRPSELLGLKVKDLNFLRTVDGKQYAQITVNGKTGTRNIPLFSSVPFIKDWLNNGHPTRGNNPNAYLIPSMDTKMYKTRGNRMHSSSINEIYRRYKHKVFPNLLNDPDTPHEDKVKLKALLQKPFNPYIRRHSALTQKAQKLSSSLLKQHAGWGLKSNMDIKYTHFFGAESNDAILSEIYELETAATLKAKKMSVALIPKRSNINNNRFRLATKSIITTLLLS